MSTLSLKIHFIGTLLNYAFKTNFIVRQKNPVSLMTTCGAWVSYNKVEKSHIVIFDIEGSDSTKRGEEKEKC